MEQSEVIVLVNIEVRYVFGKGQKCLGLSAINRIYKLQMISHSTGNICRRLSVDTETMLDGARLELP